MPSKDNSYPIISKDDLSEDEWMQKVDNRKKLVTKFFDDFTLDVLSRIGVLKVRGYVEKIHPYHRFSNAKTLDDVETHEGYLTRFQALFVCIKTKYNDDGKTGNIYILGIDRQKKWFLFTVGFDFNEKDCIEDPRTLEFYYLPESIEKQTETNNSLKMFNGKDLGIDNTKLIDILNKIEASPKDIFDSLGNAIKNWYTKQEKKFRSIESANVIINAEDLSMQL